jgi:glycosyltransferase involved in cell wall biosynthesis
LSQEYASPFDAAYFRTGCGPVAYERSEEVLAFFRSVARHVVHTLSPRSVFDAGCAMGFLAESLWDLGVEARGIDISPYAISQVRGDMQACCTLGSVTDPIDGRFDLITCIEVLEHMPAEQAEAAIANFCRTTDTILFSSTPFDFEEPTHCNVRPLIFWLKSFAAHGFRADLAYDANFVTQHAVLLRRAEPAWQDEVLDLFCRSIYQKSELAAKFGQANRAAAEASLLSARMLQFEADSEAANAHYAEMAGRCEELARENTTLAGRAARLEQNLDAACRQRDEATARGEELGRARIEAETALAETGREAAACERRLAAEMADLRLTIDSTAGELGAACARMEELVARNEALALALAGMGDEKAALMEKLEQVLHNASVERQNLQARLEKTADELARFRNEGQALATVIQDLRELYDSASHELAAIKASPGWRAVEQYRGWRHRTVARRTWLVARYEKTIDRLLRWTGVSLESATRIQPAADAPALLPPQPVLAYAPPILQPEIARFALIISGCPGDSFRYRCEHQAEEMRLLGWNVDTAVFDRVDYLQIVDQYELFVLHRVPHVPAVEQFIAMAQARRKPVLFDTDDLVFHEGLLGDIKAIRDFARHEYDLYVSGIRRYHRTLSLCSGCIVATEPLSDAVRELFPALSVWVNRNALSDAMVMQADDALRSVARHDDGVVRIAYLSGTRTHQDDFAECMPALARLLKTYRQVRFLAVGHLDLPDELQHMNGQVETSPLMPWEELPALLRRIDINLAPLEPNNRFTAAKSELKYFEAAALGVPTIASDTPAFREAITPGHNGLLCRTQAEWSDAIERLVLDPELRTRLGANARRDALRRYTTRSRAPELGDVVRDVFRRHDLLRRRDRLSVAFILRAPIARTSGGYKTIFSLARFLAGRGHAVHLYVEAIAHLAERSDEEIVDYCRRAFGESSARIHVGHQAILAADAAIATNWPTAYTVERLANARARFYLVQDYEPEFYAKDDPNYRNAERTYDLPLQKIAIGKYLGELFSARDRVTTAHFPFFLDRSIYHNCRGHSKTQAVRILFFARPGLKRRAYPVGVEALRIVARDCPEAQIALYGMPDRPDLGFAYEKLGELSGEELARAMNRSHIHVSFSLTNISWVPFEAMACGCAVVEAKVPAVESWMGTAGEHCLLAEPKPDAVAQAIIRLVKNPGLRQRIARSGEQYVATISATWDEAGEQFERILLDSLCLEARAAETAQAADQSVATLGTR